jgi:hypothetical protein
VTVQFILFVGSRILGEQITAVKESGSGFEDIAIMPIQKFYPLVSSNCGFLVPRNFTIDSSNDKFFIFRRTTMSRKQSKKSIKRRYRSTSHGKKEAKLKKAKEALYSLPADKEHALSHFLYKYVYRKIPNKDLEKLLNIPNHVPF